MKVPASVRRLYEDQKVANDRLQVVVDERTKGFKNPRWHYESRVKALHSFALKIESGRVESPGALEDFFACTLVVATSAEIERAERLVSEAFSVTSRRPPQPSRTHKEPMSFPFDDLRLYVTLRTTPDAPPAPDLEGIVFEVQVKTFLQHAWAIATYDLLYKTDDVNWSKQRIAFQIKAMLEHAEISIQEAETLATSAALAKEDDSTALMRKSIALVKEQWSADELPADLRALAGNVNALIKALTIDIERLEHVLNEGKARRDGTHPSNLSPYATVVQYLLNAEPRKMLKLLGNGRPRVRVLIPEEIELPSGIDRVRCPGAIFV